jgi:hypothetical protein
LAFALTIVATAAYWFFFTLAKFAPTGFIMDASRFLLSALLMVIAIYLLRRRRGWAQTLLVICATGLLLATTLDLFISTYMARESFAPQMMTFLFHGCLVNPWLWEPRCALMLLGWCFPLPLFAYALVRFTPASNQ